MSGGACYLSCFCAVLSLLLLRPTSTGALECHCSDCEREVCHIEQGACVVQISASQTRRGCVEAKSVLSSCLLPAITDSPHTTTVTCCYSDSCNHWSLASHRQTRISGSNNKRTGMESEESTTDSNTILKTVAIVTSAVSICTVFLMAALMSVFYCYCCRGGRRGDRERTEDIECEESNSPSPVASIGPVAFPPQWVSLSQLSSSATYPPSSLQQRHIVIHMTLEKNLEKGRFCDTYIGSWRSENILVKVFNEKAERIWFTESTIHQLPHMRHENIHCFYATDNPDSSPQRFIVLEYHRHGSLHEYLQRTTLHSYNVVTFAMSIADGLAYLHSEFADELGKKPSIAHRNINSESIYVKSNDTCCISDFSLAVTSRDSTTDRSARPEPDLRYLAPEFLTEPPARASLENLKKGDMYSYGLVLWEIARRCAVHGMVEDVCLPYSSLLQHSPVQREELRDLVVTREMRPPVPDQWNRDETMRIILRTITECWHTSSTVRLTPHRVRKTLCRLSQQIKPQKYDKNGKLLSIGRPNDSSSSKSPVEMV